MLIRTDGEPALVALKDAITKALPEGATPVKTPVGESASNGGMEDGVRIFKVLLRVHLAALERRIGAKFPSNHPVLTWLVEHVGDARCEKKRWSLARPSIGATDQRKT